MCSSDLVGGGIPALRSMKTSLASDKIVRVAGILNGTTNYILTRMKNDGGSFDDALAEAKSLGYAEADPTADVDGLDAQRKIMILAAIASGKLAPESAVKAETMRNITEADLAAAEAFGGTVKLLGVYERGADKPSLGVAPFFVPDANVLAHVDDVFNAILVNCEVTGDVMYYGRGAGRYPTAAAMVSDVCAAVNGSGKNELPGSFERLDAGDVMPFDDMKFRRLIRADAASRGAVGDAIGLEEYAVVGAQFCALTREAYTTAGLGAALAAVPGEVASLRVLG